MYSAKRIPPFPLQVSHSPPRSPPWEQAYITWARWKPRPLFLPAMLGGMATAKGAFASEYEVLLSGTQR